jgi:2-haloacid dehalogenase
VKSLSRYKHILIDLDDTLIDFATVERQTFFATLKHFGLVGSEQAYTQYKVINSELWSAYEKSEVNQTDVFLLRWQRFFQIFEKETPPADINQFYLNHIARHPILFPCASEFCRQLAAAHQLVIVTNGDARTQRLKIENSGLGPYIEALIISDDVGAAKPDSKIFAEALRSVNAAEKSGALMIGDSVRADIVGAADFGIDACWFNPRKIAPPADVVIPFTAHTYDEILQWMGFQF